MLTNQDAGLMPCFLLVDRIWIVNKVILSLLSVNIQSLDMAAIV